MGLWAMLHALTLLPRTHSYALLAELVVCIMSIGMEDIMRTYSAAEQLPFDRNWLYV